MGIAWLWYFTRSADAEHLRTLNEHRAAVIYARWGSLLRGVANLTRRARDGWRATRSVRDDWRETRRARAGRHELHALSDHILRDIGLLRDGVDGELSEPHRPGQAPRLAQPISGDARSDGAGSSGAPLAARDEAIEARSRAA